MILFENYLIIGKARIQHVTWPMTKFLLLDLQINSNNYHNML